MYYLAQNNEKTGPFTLEQLRAMWREGGVYPQTLYWEDGMADWQPLGASAAARLNLDPPRAVSVAAIPAPAAMAGADPLMPPSTSHEPSAYDLPAARLPAGPVAASPSAPMAGTFPAAGTLPARAALPTAPASGTPTSLVETTRLPGGGAGAMAPTGNYPPVAGASNEMPPAAYLSLIFSLLGPFAMLFHVVGWLFGAALLVAGIVSGHSARAAIKQSGGRLPGWGVATAGLIVGYVFVALVVLVVLVFVAFMVLAITGAIHGTHG